MKHILEKSEHEGMLRGACCLGAGLMLAAILFGIIAVIGFVYYYNNPSVSNSGTNSPSVSSNDMKERDARARDDWRNWKNKFNDAKYREVKILRDEMWTINFQLVPSPSFSMDDDEDAIAAYEKELKIIDNKYEILHTKISKEQNKLKEIDSDASEIASVCKKRRRLLDDFLAETKDKRLELGHPLTPQEKQEYTIIERAKKTEKYNKRFDELLELLETEPDNLEVQSSFAYMASTNPDPKKRDGKKAIKAALKACELTNWRMYYTVEKLGMAYAADGDFENAIKYLDKSISMKPQVSIYVNSLRQKMRAAYLKKEPYIVYTLY